MSLFISHVPFLFPTEKLVILAYLQALSQSEVRIFLLWYPHTSRIFFTLYRKGVDT